MVAVAAGGQQSSGPCKQGRLRPAQLILEAPCHLCRPLTKQRNRNVCPYAVMSFYQYAGYIIVRRLLGAVPLCRRAQVATSSACTRKVRQPAALRGHAAFGALLWRR